MAFGVRSFWFCRLMVAAMTAAALPGLLSSLASPSTRKYLPNFFTKGQLTKMFFLFPDPHFKKQKHKWRIISHQLLSEYAYCLAIGGRLYVATDVRDLYDWMTHHLDAHPLFEKLDQSVMDTDIIVDHLFNATEEAQKVKRSGGQIWVSVYHRVRDKTECD